MFSGRIFVCVIRRRLSWSGGFSRRKFGRILLQGMEIRTRSGFPWRVAPPQDTHVINRLNLFEEGNLFIPELYGTREERKLPIGHRVLPIDGHEWVLGDATLQGFQTFTS